MKRFASKSEIDAAPTLPISLSQSQHESDPISWGSQPELYLEADLKKIPLRHANRTVEFERRLLSIWWKTSQPVPFLFRTADGTLRSLDAGCVGYPLNRHPPKCDPITDRTGFIVAVRPRHSMAAGYEPIRQRLVDEVEAR